MRLPLELLPAEAKRFDLVAFGENSLDMVVSLAEAPRLSGKMPMSAYSELPGGIAATAAAACARLGWRSRYIGSFGDDRQAESVRAALVAASVDVSASRHARAANRFAVVLVDIPSGSRTVIERREANLDWPPGELDLDAMTSGRVLLVDSTDIPAATAAARGARSRGIVTVVDIEQASGGADSLLNEIDVIIAAESFPAAYTGRPEPGEALHELVKKFRPAIAVVTLGASGSLAVCQGHEIRTPGFQVPVLDTTGAGDAFRGGFVAGLLEAGTASVEHLLEYANAVAACNCRQFGAQGGLPTKTDVDALLTGRSRGRSK